MGMARFAVQVVSQSTKEDNYAKELLSLVDIKEVEKAIKDVDEGDGVILFTDMFGGTPSNLGLSFLDEGKTEVIGGVNLPMVIKASMSREGKTLKELASFIKEYGQNSISLASEILTMKSAKR